MRAPSPRRGEGGGEGVRESQGESPRGPSPLTPALSPLGRGRRTRRLDFATAAAPVCLFYVLRQERHRALPGEVRGGFLIAAALVAMEAVLGVGIDVDLAIAAALLLDQIDVAHRDRSVLLAEMHLHRHFR